MSAFISWMWPWAWRSEVRSLHNSMWSVIVAKRHCNDHCGIHITKATNYTEQNPSWEAPQLVKKFPAFYVTRRFITAFTWDHRLFLSWARPVQPHASTSLFLKVSFNIILPSTPGSSRWSPLPQVSQPKPCAHLSYIPYVPHAPPIIFYLITRIIPNTYKCHSFVHSFIQTLWSALVPRAWTLRFSGVMNAKAYIRCQAEYSQTRQPVFESDTSVVGREDRSDGKTRKKMWAPFGWIEGKERILGIERGRTRSHSM